MGRKGKTQVHTRAEINGKIKAAKEKNGAAGGGGAGVAQRKLLQVKSSIQCEICSASIPSLKTLQTHYESKHPKVALNVQEYEDRLNKKKEDAKEIKSAWK